MTATTRRRLAWCELASVVRSSVHDRTWLGHWDGATHADTPAGPLRVVKAAVWSAVATSTHTDDVPVRTEWRRHADGDGYTLWGGFAQGTDR